MEMSIFLPALPEIFLAVMGMVSMMVGAFAAPKRAMALVNGLVVISYLVCLAQVVWLAEGRGFAFGGLFVTDDFAVFMKILVLLGSALVLIMSETLSLIHISEPTRPY